MTPYTRRSISPEMLVNGGHALDDIRKASNARRTEQATRIARVANDRFEGPPRHETIGAVDLRKALLAIGLLALIPWIALLVTVVVK